ncbi:DNA topoisomerase III [Shewanella sp. NIFS-20-20]|uniref:DNA topoisomerase III n=1 Tax=Shewanella sp. NIFS-20-20 TaxID=2853806 RepID=UPI001C43C346|nr:DNA topoisomerase III [Shewanella sp. NIFS-20-20]MBV7315030.1 DNA topoisomerase III [Shewanella sp. NIFS-20-20]
MRLYIAEKPSLGRAIADVFPKAGKQQQGYITLANGDCVTWCIGHLLEQAPPDSYGEQYKQWRMADLPILPQQWQLLPKAASKSQLRVINTLLKQATELVHAGDPDREGQLLVDEVLSYCKVPSSKIANVKRLLINDLNPSAVKQALTKLRSNREFIPLSTSALARSRADWLFGMNLTRAYTLQGKKVGYQGVLSVGRVQTPVLGLVVRRDVDIEHFRAKDYYEVEAQLCTDSGEHFSARWQPSDACARYMDEEGRVISPRLADTVVAKISQQPAEVTEVEAKVKRQAPPLPYSLSSLQIDCAKRFGMAAKTVLDICQRLYEQHKLITYPRSDSRYLPVAHHGEAAKVLAAIGSNSEEMTPWIDQADIRLRSAVWNDAKVDAHHAIIPTARLSGTTRLSVDELKVYGQIARQYVLQFFEPYQYRHTKMSLLIAGGLFVAKANQSLVAGWKALMPSKEASSDDDIKSFLPSLKVGDTPFCELGVRLDKQTQAPKPFNDASLLSAMTGISRFVNDPEIRKILKETDGLGTEATRAGIIELLFNRGFLERQGKHIRATPVGRGLIASLPERISLPDMTAVWENHLSEICNKNMSYQGFMQPLTDELTELIANATTLDTRHLAEVAAKMPVKKFTAKKAKRQRRTSATAKTRSKSTSKQASTRGTH